MKNEIDFLESPIGPTIIGLAAPNVLSMFILIVILVTEGFLQP